MGSISYRNSINLNTWQSYCLIIKPEFMKKVLFVFVAVISMLAMTSCVDKEQCVGKWESENVSEDGFTGNFYLDLNENGTANLRIKGTGAVEEEGMDMKIGITAKIGGKWDVSMGYIDLEFDPNNVKCTVDDFDAGNEGVNALVKMILNDPEAKRQMVEAFKSEMNVDDFNGSLDIEFDGDNVMKLTGTDGVVLTFHRQ